MVRETVLIQDAFTESTIPKLQLSALQPIQKLLDLFDLLGILVIELD